MLKLIGSRGDKNTKTVAVLGLGKFGRSVAEELSKAGVEVVAVDMDEDRVREVAGYVTHAVQADICEEMAIKSLGLGNMDVVIVSMTGNLDASVMAILMAKEEQASYVIAKSQGEVQSKIFMKVGADRVIVPEEEAGVRIARNVSSGNFVDFIELSDRIRLLETPVKQEWIGKSLKELNLRKNYKANVVAIRKEGWLITDLDPDMALPGGITLLLVMDMKYIDLIS